MPAAKPRKTAKGKAPAKKAAAKKSVKPAARAPARAKPKPATRPEAGAAPAGPATWIVEPGPSAPAQGSAPSRAWPMAAAPAQPAFDLATGQWLPVAQASAPAALPPEATRKGTARYVLLTILLWFDLVLLALFVLIAMVTGAILLFAPDSAAADEVRKLLEGGSKEGLVLNTLLTFVMFGVIPFLWVLGTRQQAKEGTKRFLHLHEPAKGMLRGIGLAVVLLLSVAVLISVYTIGNEGVDGLTHPSDEPNPAVQDILDNLSWPIAVLVALCAGVGEEVFFRGFLQRYLGVWGQGILFGLAHATGGYVPQVLFALGMGVLFGFLVKRGWSLWTLITAHFLYDFTLLALALVAPGFG